jgi:hypothetical protein
MSDGFRVFVFRLLIAKSFLPFAGKPSTPYLRSLQSRTLSLLSPTGTQFNALARLVLFYQLLQLHQVERRKEIHFLLTMQLSLRCYRWGILFSYVQGRFRWFTSLFLCRYSTENALLALQTNRTIDAAINWLADRQLASVEESATAALRPNLFRFLQSWIALALKLRSGTIDCHSGLPLVDCRYASQI